MNDSKKINVAELLLNCPTGMELDCAMYDNCTFEGIEDVGYINIKIKTPSGIIDLTKEGCYIRHDENAKCVIFPKGKNTWEGFTPPHQFKDGDICYIKTEDIENIFIFKSLTYDFINRYVNLCDNKLITDNGSVCKITSIKEFRFANEEEKKTLFDVIEAKGYKWNSETKSLEKLIKPKFKIGDIIQDVNADGHKVRITKVNIDEKSYDYEYLDIQGWSILLFSEQDKWKLVNDNFESKSISPKFKEGDRIVLKDNPYNMPSLKIKTVTNELYILEEGFFYITSTDERYVLENKFNINDLKPFDKVLVRYNSDSVWIAQLFEAYDKTQYWPIFCVGHTRYPQCIPYKNNEHLLGTTNECDEFYKTWED